ncbi:YaaC family protein [Lentibacillus sp. N15]|uniref:YaaC family protein n=1 Tax=Lentibacillus songyuanensis TaxID=3136161 RepID=UPI0031BB8D14
MTQEDPALFYTYLQSQETAQSYLEQQYTRLNSGEAKAKSYENCTAFMYYLDHGNQFFTASRHSPMFMQPILLFYGLTHLLKACLLTKRPNYPESTSILAHGVSTRKRKKKQYTFVNDEVKIQHNGLFSYAAKHVYNMDSLRLAKIKMGKLFSLLPEMNDLWAFSGQSKLTVVGRNDNNRLLFPATILDDYCLTQKAFVHRISAHIPVIRDISLQAKHIHIELDRPILCSNGPFFCHQNGTIYFPSDRDYYLAIPEALIHYLLLYNLSMISRYETEWWGELLTAKSDIDFPLIKQFLLTATEKIPFLLAQELTI